MLEHVLSTAKGVWFEKSKRRSALASRVALLAFRRQLIFLLSRDKARFELATSSSSFSSHTCISANIGNLVCLLANLGNNSLRTTLSFDRDEKKTPDLNKLIKFVPPSV